MSTPASRPRARRGEGAQLREEILDAADALLVEGGDGAVTLRAVASSVGVTTPSVYRHFADRRELVEAVARRAWQELDALMAETVAGVDDPFVALRRRGRAYVEFGCRRPAHYALLMMRPGGDGGVVAADAAQESLKHLTEGVQACVDAGVFVGDATELALSAWAAVHGCVSLLIAQPEFPWPEDLDAYIDRTVRMAGLGTAISSRLDGPLRSPGPRLGRNLDRFVASLTKEQGS